MAARLDKVLAEMGAGTRSEVKKKIQKGLVSVNGAVVKDPGQKVGETDRITCEGEEIRYVEREYYLFHKPAGCVSATEDPVHRTVMDYIASARRDLFPVGRLDIDTEGLLLITNDGLLAHELLSPSKHVEKTYYARVAGRVTDREKELFLTGVDIGGGEITRPARLTVLQGGEESEVTLAITEGKFHQVKRMFEAVGMRVLYLKRLSMGPLVLPDDLKPGGYRPLTEEELHILRGGDA